MFTGLVEGMGRVTAIVPDPPGVRIVVHYAPIATDARLGDSICVSGCCLTIIDIDKETMAFQAGDETLQRTHLGDLQPDSEVNLERSLRAEDRLGGHFVTGHIDSIGTLVERIDEAEWSTFWFEMPPRLGGQMISKGSIAVDGVSLTLVDVTADRFSVALIPHTLEMTTLGQLQPEDRVNLETDLLAKYVEKQLVFRDSLSAASKSSSARC